MPFRRGKHYQNHVCCRSSDQNSDRVTRAYAAHLLYAYSDFSAQDKHTTSGANERYAFAVSEMQGWRICEHRPIFTASIRIAQRSSRFVNRPYLAMEDAHATVLELDDREKNAFFAVYDGHGGTLRESGTRPSECPLINYTLWQEGASRSTRGNMFT